MTDTVTLVVEPSDLASLERCALGVARHIAEHMHDGVELLGPTHPALVRGMQRLADLTSFIRPFLNEEGEIVMRGARSAAVFALTSAMERQLASCDELRRAGDREAALDAWQRAARFADMAARANDGTNTTGARSVVRRGCLGPRR